MNSDAAALWKRIQDGDHRAWSELVTAHAGLVYGVARRAGLDPPDAEDCAQWTWLALYRTRHSLRDAAALPAWLARTARRRAQRMVKSRGRRSPAASTPADPAVVQPDTAEFAELCRDLPLALERLDPRCRQLLKHLFLDTPELSYREAASRLGLDPDTIGPMRSRCLERLGEILRKMGWELH